MGFTYGGRNGSAKETLQVIDNTTDNPIYRVFRSRLLLIVLPDAKQRK